ncbi:MAG: tRNA dihydrouridine synthase DusB [Betaproteobacteria bacterium]|nr:tRNA dihydrouridine synthase DusB [Betaproteobacteria bacterium]
MRIGPHTLRNNLVVAPMAGVTDRPFRQLCKRLGAGLAVSEMVASNSLLWGSEKTLRRGNHEGEVEPKVVQIAGGNPEMMADAASYNISRGAQIIDINMGCPAKKICNVQAGSALLKDEDLVARILAAVLAVAQPRGIPVTLKIRTGWDRSQRNALRVARLAENAGVAALAIHGRTRADQYQGEAEYDTIREVKHSVGIPVIANGDINTPEKARFVLDYTGVDGIMIGRAAQGRPWIFREIGHYLATGEKLPPPTLREIAALLIEHLDDHYRFYGEAAGVKVARKHIGWYVKGISGAAAFRRSVNELTSGAAQMAAITQFFERLQEREALISEEGVVAWEGLAA